MARHWIQGAIKNPGSLHRALGVPEGEKIPAKKMAAAAAGRYGATNERRAHLAETLGHMHHTGDHRNVDSRAAHSTMRRYDHLVPSRAKGGK